MANRRPSSSMEDREEDKKRIKLSPEGDSGSAVGGEEKTRQAQKSPEDEGKETERRSGTDGKEENGKEGASGTDSTETDKKKVKAKSKKERKKELKEQLKLQRQEELKAAKAAKKAELQAEKEREKKRQKTELVEGEDGGKDEQGKDLVNGKEQRTSTVAAERRRRRRRERLAAAKQQAQPTGGGTYRCEWMGCGRPCADLVDHINRTHVGAGLRSYTCGWEGCTRKQEPFTKRPAMMKHLKKHLRPIGLGDFELADYRSKSAASDGKKEEAVKKKPTPDEDPDVVLGRQGAYSRVELRSSDVVWIKISGYPWWPARLESPFDSPANMDMAYAENVPVGSLLVRLYGVNRLQWVTDEQILGFKAFWDEFHGKCQLKLFLTALGDAQRDSNHYPAVSPNPQLGPLTGNRNRSSISIARQPPSQLPSGTLLPPPSNTKPNGASSPGAPPNTTGLARPGGYQGQGPPPRHNGPLPGSKGSSPVPGGQPTATHPLSVSPQPKGRIGRPSGAVSPNQARPQ
eukprot:comp22645_c0_seq1/m.34894 comp22645_c0_seq1/g.34894  ORF comp22645_c0_seq1/g.34894 comp22645_c0_seq1/m.34894 type:complete len:516 (-) comp22645_c0_seq1:651-2198(-)